MASVQAMGYLSKVGLVSDKKLLDLLDLALSVDATNTIRRVRKLIGSGIESMALMSQLATLIMDSVTGSIGQGPTNKGISSAGLL